MVEGWVETDVGTQARGVTPWQLVLGVAALVGDGEAIQVHPEAELDGIADILQPWVGHGLVQADIDALEALVIMAGRWWFTMRFLPCSALPPRRMPK